MIAKAALTKAAKRSVGIAAEFEPTHAHWVPDSKATHCAFEGCGAKFGAKPALLEGYLPEDNLPTDMNVVKCVSAEAAWYFGHFFRGYLRGNYLLGSVGALRGDWATDGGNQREAPFSLQQYFPLANSVSGHCPCASCCELAGAVCHRSRGEGGGPARADVARTSSLA